MPQVGPCWFCVTSRKIGWTTRAKDPMASASHKRPSPMPSWDLIQISICGSSHSLKKHSRSFYDLTFWVCCKLAASPIINKHDMCVCVCVCFLSALLQEAFTWCALEYARAISKCSSDLSHCCHVTPFAAKLRQRDCRNRPMLPRPLHHTWPRRSGAAMKLLYGWLYWSKSSGIS